MKKYFDNGRATLMFAGALILMFLVMLMVGECVNTSEAAETVVVSIRDFGRGMELLPSPYRNDPEAVAYSENFYSVQPGVGMTRYGTTEFIDYNTSPIDGDVESIVDFTPVGDSAAIVFAAGGKWYWSFYGKRSGNKMDFVSSIAVPRTIEPRSAGVVNYTHGDTTITGDASTGTYWVRNMMAGDTMIVDTGSGQYVDTFVVRRVVSDILAVVDSVNDISGNLISDNYKLRRAYGGSYPFLYSAGDFVYTGSTDDRPQTIYKHNDTLHIRELKMVDSVYVDAIYNFYMDTLSDGTLKRRSWDTLPSGDTAIVEIQVVSRRADWSPDQWLQAPLRTGLDIPTTYFVRLGWHQNNIKNRAKFFPIRGNVDTAIYLSAWYVSDTLGNSKLWRDSTLSGYGLRMQDTMANSDLSNSPWAYIYCATGFSEVIADDRNTDTIEAYGRGAVWKITDTSGFWINPDTFYTGMYYLHLTADDIEFPAYSQGAELSTYTITLWPGDPPIDDIVGPRGDSVVDFETQCYAWPSGIVCARIYTVVTFDRTQKPVDAKYLTDAYFPIRYGQWSSDTLVIVTSAATVNMLGDASTDKTVNWEIVRIGLPRWSGMTSWGNPEQLIAWGDTASPSLISQSYPDDHWNWSAENDLIPGDLNDPIAGIIGYDDQILVFKDASIAGFDGVMWKEISQSDGLVGSRAVVGQNKEAYFVDRDAVKMIQRRDFSGYSIQSISSVLDPVFGAWDTLRFNRDVVPFTVNPLKRHLSRLTYNPFDKHLYLFFPQGADSANSKCLTYDLRAQSWDGYLNLAAADAFWMEWDDTVKVVCAASEYGYAPDTAVIFAIDPATWEDLSNDATVDEAINAVRRSHKFGLRDQAGRLMNARLVEVRITHRGQQTALAANSRFVIAANRNLAANVTAARDSVDLDVPGTFADEIQYWRPSSDLVGAYWQFEIYVNGVTDGPYPYQIYGIEMEFAPIGEDD